MPKLKKAYDPWERYRGAVVGRMIALDIGFSDLAVQLGVSRPTAYRYVKDPGVMSLDTMRRLNRVLDITAEAARDALAYK